MTHLNKLTRPTVSRLEQKRAEGMNRPPLEVADIIRAVGKTFIEKHRSWLHLKVLSAIESFRTAALGGHRDQCSCCGHTVAISYNSCIHALQLGWPYGDTPTVVITNRELPSTRKRVEFY